LYKRLIVSTLSGTLPDERIGWGRLGLL